MSRGTSQFWLSDPSRCFRDEELFQGKTVISSERKTVLYVEDNPVNILLVEAIFASRANARLLTAMYGSVGLELAEHERPDLILLDLHLPDMNGDVFLAKLRAIESTAAIPVVIVSADALDEQRSRFLDLGAAAYIAKPFELAEFEKVMDRYLG